MPAWDRNGRPVSRLSATSQARPLRSRPESPIRPGSKTRAGSPRSNRTRHRLLDSRQASLFAALYATLPRARGARRAADVRLEVAGEHLQRAGHEPHDAVGVAARPPSDDGVTTDEEALEPLLVTLAVGNRLEVVSDRRQAEQARPALAGALGCHVAGNARSSRLCRTPSSPGRQARRRPSMPRSCPTRREHKGWRALSGVSKSRHSRRRARLEGSPEDGPPQGCGLSASPSRSRRRPVVELRH